MQGREEAGGQGKEVAKARKNDRSNASEPCRWPSTSATVRPTACPKPVELRTRPRAVTRVMSEGALSCTSLRTDSGNTRRVQTSDDLNDRSPGQPVRLPFFLGLLPSGAPAAVLQDGCSWECTDTGGTVRYSDPAPQRAPGVHRNQKQTAEFAAWQNSPERLKLDILKCSPCFAGDSTLRLGLSRLCLDLLWWQQVLPNRLLNLPDAFGAFLEGGLFGVG